MKMLVNIKWTVTVFVLIIIGVESDILCAEDNHNTTYICSDQKISNSATLPNICKRVGRSLSITFLLKNTTILKKSDFLHCGFYRLQLENGSLEEILPNTFEDFNRLELLNVSKNNLKKFYLSSLPTEIENYRYDKLSVDLSYNKIVEVISDSIILPEVTDLDLSYNSISNLSKICFPDPDKLNYLSLSYNELESIPFNTISKLHRLISLNISGNKLHNLPFGVFNNLHQLSTLDLSNNQLLSSDLHTVYGLNQLNSFYFHHNQIDYFDIDHLPATIRAVSFYGNKLAFSCQELSKIVLKYQRIEILYGHEFDEENVHGIACNRSTIKEDRSSSKDAASLQIIFQQIRNESKSFLDQLKVVLKDNLRTGDPKDLSKQLTKEDQDSTISLNAIQFTSLTIILMIIMILLVVNMFKSNFNKSCFKTKKVNERRLNGLGLDSSAQQELLEI